MAALTPRRSLRVPHTHTPKMSERKKGLFLGVEVEIPPESLTKHRRLSVVDSESDSDCDLGIIAPLDSSSGEENDQQIPRTPKKTPWHDTRGQSKKLKENQDLKNFMKSPFTLTKYQTRYSCPESRCTGSLSTPATPHFQNHPGTPSSTHSCASVHTTSSTSSRARKSLASLIADTESCSSSLKDLNFDTDSGTDSKENTPTKSVRRSSRRHVMTPKLKNFKGILVEQKKNVSPMKNAVVCLTKMDMSSIISPTQMMKTPHNTSESKSPPKLGHRRSMLEIEESPESNCDSEKSHKRLHYEGMTDIGPTPKFPRLDVPKARLSLFNSDRLKEILSAKSFYGKSNPDLNASVTAKISNAIEATNIHHRRPFAHAHSNKRKRKPGQINMGVRHRIRKPKILKNKMVVKSNSYNSAPVLHKSDNSLNNTLNDVSMSKDLSVISQTSSQDLENEKTDPFGKEKQTIEALLSQWTEEEIPESELIHSKPKEIPCFNSTIIEETNQIFQPITAVPVLVSNSPKPDSETVIVELGATGQETGVSEKEGQDVVMVDDGHRASHGDAPKCGGFLPVEGGYIYVGGDTVPGQEIIPDLDEIERELKMLDEQILLMEQTGSTEEALTTEPAPDTEPSTLEEPQPDKPQKLFSIFNNPNPGTSTPSSKGAAEKSKKLLLKSGTDQYVIDAGQKKFGATQCNECGVIYEIGDPQDEHDHLVHHNAIDVLRFNGWKEECVVDTTATGRCIRVRGGESGWKRVQNILSRVVHPHLGYEASLPRDPRSYTAYLYVEKKLIVGCLIMEPKMKAHKLIPGNPDCCSIEEYPVKCGVSRIWTHANYRRRGIARTMLDCARASLLHADVVPRHQLCFSAPTPAGKALAASYCGTTDFYVYLD